MKYTGLYKKHLSFPLGGIGTGSIGLAGTGGFTDIEIMNRPNKESDPSFTNFAIKAEDEEKVVDARVLMTDQQPDYMGNLERPRYTGFGFGPDRGSMAGFPHFEDGDFDGEYPVAKLDFKDQKFPGEISIEAFNPFIPTNSFNSSLPVTFFKIRIKNTTEKPLDYTVAMSCCNFYTKGRSIHTFQNENGYSQLVIGNEKEKATDYGDLTITTDSENVSYQEYWFRGSWFDNVAVFWKDFTSYGELKNRHYQSDKKNYDVFSTKDVGTLASHVRILSGEEKELRYVLTWSCPYMNNHWEITDPGLTEEEKEERRKVIWKTYYATQFEDSAASGKYAIENFGRLLNDTMLYHDIIYRSSLPTPALDAVTANTAIIKSTTCLRLEDGSFYAFEGVHAHLGS